MKDINWDEMADMDIETAALYYDKEIFGIPTIRKTVFISEDKHSEYITDAFKAGVKWKELQEEYDQPLKDILLLANQLAAAVMFKEDAIPNLLVGYTNREVFNKLQAFYYKDESLLNK